MCTAACQEIEASCLYEQSHRTRYLLAAVVAVPS